MIKTKFVKILKRGLKSINYYNQLGYDTTKDFEISIDNLSTGSKIKIDLICDICSGEYNMQFKDYLRFNKIPHFICKNCKRKKTNLDKYGTENVFQSEDIKDKIKETNLIRYGHEFANSSITIKQKSKKTNLDKYGTENVFQSEDIKDKIKETNLIRYGHEYYSQTDEYIEKIKLTNLKRYGFEFYTQTDEYKKISASTNLAKYGFVNPMMSDNIKTKSKETFISKYGGYTLESKELSEKVKKTCLEKYGTDKIKKNEKYRKKSFKISNDENYIKYISECKSLFKCDIEGKHDFEITSSLYYNRINNDLPICTVCNPISENRSIKEKELYEFIKSIYTKEILKSYRDSLEIDIYLPDMRLGFEFNGLFWHSNQFKEKNYHLTKTNYFKEKDIRIIHIWEDDWTFKKDIIKSQIANLIGKSKKIWGRNCEVKEIFERKLCRDFLKSNHIQGNYKNINKSFGLFHNNELVSLMTFDHFEGRKKMNQDDWNISRFCNKLNYTVVGGSSKLLKYFIKNYSPKRIISYADKSWSIGELYNKLGFKVLNETEPDYKYIEGNIRKHKSGFKKSTTGISESKLTLDRIYDCGKIKFEKLL